MYRVNACDPSYCVSFGFEFTSSKSFDDYTSYGYANHLFLFLFSSETPSLKSLFPSSEVSLPVVQMAFAYYALVESEGVKPRLQKRLRIFTSQLGMGTTTRDVYNGAEYGASLALLLHKVMRASLQKGMEESRLMLQDWLTMLIVHYNEGLIRSKEVIAESDIDITFEKHPKLEVRLPSPCFPFLTLIYFSSSSSSSFLSSPFRLVAGAPRIWLLERSIL